ncbi:hypothetical protein M422DRAFT_24239 [Sphaerobolus stellatus SS14]|nr:hypothetical protein M422DRAFT_24239 [Sphaerobolus stellatus SS14]
MVEHESNLSQHQHWPGGTEIRKPGARRFTPRRLAHMLQRFPRLIEPRIDRYILSPYVLQWFKYATKLEKLAFAAYKADLTAILSDIAKAPKLRNLIFVSGSWPPKLHEHSPMESYLNIKTLELEGKWHFETFSRLVERFPNLSELTVNDEGDEEDPFPPSYPPSHLSHLLTALKLAFIIWQEKDIITLLKFPMPLSV